MIRIALLGSTGSIGESTLAVVERHPDRFRVTALGARRSCERLRAQAERHGPTATVLVEPDDAADPAWGRGTEALCALGTRPDVDVVVNAVVGFAGLAPTLAALEAGKRVALANKESLVAGGPLVARALERGGGTIVPIDSEHSAILQCLSGYEPDDVARLVLTASGGPFRGWSRDALRAVGPSDALRHPTWNMGSKITVDSATLANKALEVIEAHVLYGIDFDRIDVVVHPQSIVHSFVEFHDGSVLAQLGYPTMELPILIALSHPERVPDAELRTFDPVRMSPLTFEPVDDDAFPLFGVGVRAGRAGGTAPAVFNAANEVAVASFLDGRLPFLEMAGVVEDTLAAIAGPEAPDLAALEDVDARARAHARAAVAVHARAEARP